MSLHSTRIAVVGCGGLGVPAAWALVRGGARKLRLIDDDTVEESNLHRQILFAHSQIGRPKHEMLALALRAMAAQRGDTIDIEIRTGRVDASNTELLLSGCDAAIEGSDDAACKFAVNDWAVSDRAGRAVRVASIAAAIGRRGQWLVVEPGGGCYRCLFEEPPPAELLSTCSVAGVMGPVVGQVGALAARSLLRALRGEPDRARSALVQRLPTGFRTIAVPQSQHCRCSRGWRACG